MNFTEAIKTCFSKYITFSGRASRSEFWYFTLFIIVVNKILSQILLLVPNADFVKISSLLLFYLMNVPFLAVLARRFHDTNRSMIKGFVAYIGLVIGLVVLTMTIFLLPWLGVLDFSARFYVNLILIAAPLSGISVLGCGIYLLYVLCSSGTCGPNRFGADPLANNLPAA